MDKVAPLLHNSMSYAWKELTNYFELLMTFVQDSRLGVYILSLSMAAVFLLYLKTCSSMMTEYVLKKKRNAYKYIGSPINIVRSGVLLVNWTRQNQLEWFNYYDTTVAAVLQNNGSSVMLHISCEPDIVPYVSGASLQGNYYFVEASFKWGGSEHLIDSRRYSLELQVLHATNNPNTSFEFLTISYLFITSRYQCHSLKQVIKNLSAIVNKGSTIELPCFDLPGLCWPFHSDYYSYMGNYTNGRVVLPTLWFVCASTFYLSAEQLNEFTNIRDADSRRIAGNSRSEMPLNQRNVYLNQFA